MKGGGAGNPAGGVKEDAPGGGERISCSERSRRSRREVLAKDAAREKQRLSRRGQKVRKAAAPRHKTGALTEPQMQEAVIHMRRAAAAQRAALAPTLRSSPVRPPNRSSIPSRAIPSRPKYKPIISLSCANLFLGERRPVVIFFSLDGFVDEIPDGIKRRDGGTGRRGRQLPGEVPVKVVTGRSFCQVVPSHPLFPERVLPLASWYTVHA